MNAIRNHDIVVDKREDARPGGTGRTCILKCGLEIPVDWELWPDIPIGAGLDFDICDTVVWQWSYGTGQEIVV